MTYQEAIALIDRNQELKAQLKNKWFYLGGEGLKKSGHHTFDDEDKLVEGRGDIEKTVYAYSGNKPLSLHVQDDGYARLSFARFEINTWCDPQYVAPVVIGVRADYEVAMPKIEASNGAKIDPELLSEFKSVVAKMDSATKTGVLKPEMT